MKQYQKRQNYGKVLQQLQKADSKEKIKAWKQNKGALAAPT